jgi:hypothetical protein
LLCFAGRTAQALQGWLVLVLAVHLVFMGLKLDADFRGSARILAVLCLAWIEFEAGKLD